MFANFFRPLIRSVIPSSHPCSRKYSTATIRTVTRINASISSTMALPRSCCGSGRRQLSSSAAAANGRTEFDYDLVVIGGGSGGVATARRAVCICVCVCVCVCASLS
jgi:hypothetical protein